LFGRSSIIILQEAFSLRQNAMTIASKIDLRSVNLPFQLNVLQSQG